MTTKLQPIHYERLSVSEKYVEEKMEIQDDNPE